VLVQVRYEDGPRTSSMARSCWREPGRPACGGGRDDEVKLVTPGIPAHQFRRKLAATHIHDPDHTPTVGLHSDHGRESYPVFVGCGAPGFIRKRPPAAVKGGLRHAVGHSPARGARRVEGTHNLAPRWLAVPIRRRRRWRGRCQRDSRQSRLHEQHKRSQVARCSGHLLTSSFVRCLLAGISVSGGVI
jgi:hypothetical protein